LCHGLLWPVTISAFKDASFVDADDTFGAGAKQKTETAQIAKTLTQRFITFPFLFL
jgi:hypothetical protein